MKEYFLSKQTVFSGLGRITSYYHLLIDFIIPLYVDSRGDDITVNVESRCLDPMYNRPVRTGVMSNDRVRYIINSVFDDRITFKNNKNNISCGKIWLNVEQRDTRPLPKILQNIKPWWLSNFETCPQHRGIWGEYDQSHYNFFRENMWYKFNIPEPESYYVTIIYRGEDAHLRGKLPKDISNKIEQHFKTSLPTRVVNFGDLTFEQTIQICRESKVLIGQHGAGIANCVFMQPGSEIIEYGPFKLPCYHVLANCCGLLYNRTSLRDSVINIHDE